jgi:NhaA family Na+:H+ antiporter
VTADTAHLDPLLGERRERVDRFVRPIQQFIATETAGGVVLLLAAIVALVWANSPWEESYHHLLDHHLAFDLGFWGLDAPVHFWINDVAMVVFFFVVGLEIKREVVIGELSDLRRVVVPIAGALGGMLVPALIFTAFLRGGPGASGWGIPIATDIAFALGVLAVVGPRVPFGLKVMLLALAIVDDIGGIIVIAIFYTSELDFMALGLVMAVLVAAVAFRQLGVWFLPLYFGLGAVGWAATVESGIHPTIIGVVLGLLAPWKAWYRELGFTDLAERQLSRFREAAASRDEEFAQEQKVSAALRLRDLATKAVALDRLEHELQPIVAFVVVPVFAFANAGVEVSVGTLGGALSSPVALGVFFGLVVGKPVGITLATWVAVRLGARLPTGVRWPSVVGMGLLGGIGFTVSLLITELSYSDAVLLTDAKLGIIFGSLLSGVAGFLILRAVLGGPARGER